MMNEKLEKVIKFYMILSWFVALGVALYYLIVIPILKYDMSSTRSDENQLIQQISSSNLTLSEKAFYLEITEEIYQPIIQGYQNIILLISPKQFTNYEIPLMAQSFILTLIWLFI
jgi:beta-lactamase regulating signal transducer with metallopeptidase domain